jgi:hypothetical protein
LFAAFSSMCGRPTWFFRAEMLIYTGTEFWSVRVTTRMAAEGRASLRGRPSRQADWKTYIPMQFLILKSVFRLWMEDIDGHNCRCKPLNSWTELSQEHISVHQHLRRF